MLTIDTCTLQEEENKLVFPGILKTNKAKISTFDPAKGTSFIGFQPTHLKLDINVTGNRNALLEGVDFSSVVSVRKIAQTGTNTISLTHLFN